ncbi:hypothetical protein FVA95_24310 [Pseudonocardia sp. EV170527-09]|nr:hypothetical protein FVA95_24310 [Pseudonocardia sp. EV170527-09]
MRASRPSKSTGAASLTGPDEFDCSGLMLAAWAHAGVPISAGTVSQKTASTNVPIAQITPVTFLIKPGVGLQAAGRGMTDSLPLSLDDLGGGVVAVAGGRQRPLIET